MCMIRIEPYSLWLGHAGDCRETAKVLDAGVQAVVQLAIEESPAQFPRDIIFIRIPLLDGSDNSRDALRLAINVVGHLLSAGVPTLLCCSAGMSRSPAVAACAIARIEKRTPLDALDQIRNHIGTDISPGLWRELIACSSE